MDGDQPHFKGLTIHVAVPAKRIRIACSRRLLQPSRLLKNASILLL